MRHTFRMISRICLCLPLVVGCQVGSEPRVSNAANAAPAPHISCAGDPKALSAAPISPATVGPSLAYLQEFEREAYDLELGKVTSLSGECAPLVNAALMVNNIIGLSDGGVYQITANGLVPWPVTYSDMFERAKLERSDIPHIAGARFVHAVGVGGLRYVGLWQQNKGWLVVDFAVSKAGEGVVAPRPLLRSSLPLRSVAYFPSPDTPAGALYLVQEAPAGEMRVIGFRWWHRK